MAFEPEVAALHCRSIPSENLSGSTKRLEEMFKPGIKFAVLDLGGSFFFSLSAFLCLHIYQVALKSINFANKTLYIYIYIYII